MTSALPAGLRTQAYINGNFADAADGATFESLAPATGRAIATIAACGERDVDRAVAASRAAFTAGSWSRRPPADRKAALLRLADLIESNSEELAVLESVDAGKPITDCRTFDVPDVLNTIRWYAEAVDKVFGKVSPTGPDHLGLIVREPVGVVGAVLPWNFPAAMLAWKIAPGCTPTSTWSPSPARPRSAASSCATRPTATSRRSSWSAAARARRWCWPTAGTSWS